MESTHIVSPIIHFTHTEEMHASVAYGTNGMYEFLAGEPTVAKGVCGTEPSLPRALHHGYCAVGLLHVQFLMPCMVGVLFITLLGELPLTFIPAQAVVALLALLAVQGEVNGYRGTPVEVGQYQFLEAQHALVSHMVEHAADTLD